MFKKLYFRLTLFLLFLFFVTSVEAKEKVFSNHSIGMNIPEIVARVEVS